MLGNVAAPKGPVTRLDELIDRLSSVLNGLDGIKARLGILDPPADKTVSENPLSINDKIEFIATQARIACSRTEDIKSYLDTL